MFQVLVVDDHPLILQGIRTAFRQTRDIRVVAFTSDGRLAVDLACRHRPDVALLDVQMPGIDGITVARELHDRLPSCRVIALSGYGLRMIVLEMLEAGAVGYVLKESAEEELVTAVRSVLAGEVHVTPCLRACIPKRLLSPGTFDPPRLTGRERDVLTLIANGRSRKDVATSLGVAVQSVDYHVHEIQRRLETDALSDVLRYAITRGWIDDQGARRAEAPVAGPSA